MTHDKFEGERTLMRIHIGESDKWHGKPLYEAIVEMLRQRRILWGHGSARRRRLRRIEHLSHRQNSSPIARLADRAGGHRYAESIEKILPRLDEMVEGGLITLEKVRVILYRAAKK